MCWKALKTQVPSLTEGGQPPGQTAPCSKRPLQGLCTGHRDISCLLTAGLLWALCCSICLPEVSGKGFAWKTQRWDKLAGSLPAGKDLGTQILNREWAILKPASFQEIQFGRTFSLVSDNRGLSLGELHTTVPTHPLLAL